MFGSLLHQREPNSSGRSGGGAAFWLAQLALAAVAVTLWLVGGEPRGLELPAWRNEPLQVAPTYDDPRVVSDTQLAMVLDRLRPRLAGDRPKINSVDHGLRFWGLEAEFHDPQCLSGAGLRDVLLDHAAFAAAWGPEAEPLLRPKSPNRLAVLTRKGPTSASHVDHTLATLAEVGTPLDYAVRTPSGEQTVEDMLREALTTFSLNQPEYEWTTMALTLWAPQGQPWRTAEGQEITFDRLADRVMREAWSDGVCYGNHRLYALVLMLRVDDEHDLLSDSARERILRHLTEATQRLASRQSAEGWWDRNWPDGGKIDPNDPTDDLSRRMLATGHALEWWAMAPEEVHPPREVIIRAGQWLVQQVESMDERVIDNSYPFLTHVGRALSLWRGRFPAAAYRELQPWTQRIPAES